MAETNFDAAGSLNSKISPVIETAVLSGTIGNSAMAPASIPYPTGWTKNNTFVIGVQVRYSNTDGWYLEDTGIQVIARDAYIYVYTTNSAFFNK